MVAAGTYTYKSSGDPCTFLVTRAVVCFVDMNLSIYGGYNSTNWSDRNPQKYPTIIDGVNTYRGVAVIAYNSTASMLMDGFTIQNGLAQGAQNSDPFYNSAFGGGIWAQNSAVTLRNATLKNNRSIGANLTYPAGGSGSGGALAIQSTKQGSSTLDHVIFDGNQALGGSGASRGGVGFGGAVFAFGSSLTGTNLTFTNNTARAGSSSGSGHDGGLSADALGGAMGFGNGCSVTLSQVTATGNQALGGNAGTSGSGGGGFGGGFFSENGTISVTDARIQANLAQGGVANVGGVAMGGGDHDRYE